MLTKTSGYPLFSPRPFLISRNRYKKIIEFAHGGQIDKAMK